MNRRFYDSIPINTGILLDLPMREGIGTKLHDLAKASHPVTIVGAPSWTTIASGLNVIETDGLTNQYLKILAASCVDLDFTAGDYSLSLWVNWAHGDTSQILMSRYVLDNNGWELYFTEYGAAFNLTLRQHHAGTIVDGHPRSAGNSVGWAQGTWWHVGISRSGIACPHYRNGVAVDMTYSTGGLVDPESSPQSFRHGIRFTEGDNHLKGPWQRPRIWGRALSAAEWKQIYESEKGWFP